MNINFLTVISPVMSTNINSIPTVMNFPLNMLIFRIFVKVFHFNTCKCTAFVLIIVKVICFASVQSIRSEFYREFNEHYLISVDICKTQVDCRLLHWKLVFDCLMIFLIWHGHIVCTFLCEFFTNENKNQMKKPIL